MTYELALELKEAGFPQTIVDPMSYYSEKSQKRFGWSEGEDPPGQMRWIKIPTLSELIEACGEDFRGLTKDDDTMSNLTRLHWAAHARADLIEVGPTPEEAVARLWLALNK